MNTNNHNQELAAAARQRLLNLLTDAGLPHPDHVDETPNGVSFYWTEQKVAVKIDLDDLLDEIHDDETSTIS